MTKHKSKENPKAFQICDLDGGMDRTRLASTEARSFFKSAISDVEFIREYVAEVAAADSYRGEFPSLLDLASTLDYEGRGLPKGSTTRSAGLGFCDDRPSRRMERYQSENIDVMPIVGNKQTDFNMLDSL